MAAPHEWTLDVVARCEPLQALLTAADRAVLRAVLQRRASASARESQQSLNESLGATGDAVAAPSSHLERWKQWKLDDEHIERLTSAQGATAELLNEYVCNARFFARGKRGVLYAGELRATGAPVVMKLGAASADPSGVASLTASAAIDAEAKWLRVMNRMGIGAKLHASGPGWILCERLDGRNVVDFLGAASTSSALARWVLREMLCQCFAMDLMGINKDEMTHPHRHILVHAVASTTAAEQVQTHKCTFIDFEKCVYSSKPKNVTQLCQFLTSPRMVALFRAKGVVFEIPHVRRATKTYKQNATRAFSALMRVFGL